jgi:MFS superfamily sulfate permease-like transporter
VLAFGRRVGEPVGFDDGPNDDDRQRNPCQTIVGKHKQQEQKNKKKERYDAIYIYRVSDSATFARVATMYIQISMK